tara:strand:- start:114 stop:944 length:831 start_codon:yes stop_codon:yes gene_type:complete
MKAASNDFWGRFREIVSDPLNLLIERCSTSGMVDKDGYVCLHNGNKVPLTGENSYYGDFSKVLLLNSGVHEPLEEFCFQETLKKITDQKPMMIELGSNWAHYSMWFLKKFPKADCFMVEPDKKLLNVGYSNFQTNNFLNGQFILAKVANDGFKLDSFTNEKKIKKVSILHSDIQGWELEMLDGAKKFFTQKIANYVFLSTHSQKIHEEAKRKLESFGYIIEVSSNFDDHTTSYDGFILATASPAELVFKTFRPFGRNEIASSTPTEMVKYLNAVLS